MDLYFENKNNFKMLLIKPCDIDHLNWEDSTYAEQLSNLDTYDLIETNPETFNILLYEKLNTLNIDIKNIVMDTIIVHEDLEYIYELIYIKYDNIKNISNTLNNISTLLNISGITIYGNAILIKNFIPSNNVDNMSIIDCNKDDIVNILYNRVYTKIVTWTIENKWNEIAISGNLDLFLTDFFEEYSYKKINITFLRYNIDLYYLEEEYEGSNTICGNLLSKKIDKCVICNMKTEDLRGSITLDEVNKIIMLSRKLDIYETPGKYLLDTYDKHGRKIIYSKYRILIDLFNYYF